MREVRVLRKRAGIGDWGFRTGSAFWRSDLSRLEGGGITEESGFLVGWSFGGIWGWNSGLS